MDDGLLGILGFVLVFVALDVAALRFGVDSRNLTRDLPLPGDPVVRMPRLTGRRVGAQLSSEFIGGKALPARPVPSHSLAPIARVQRFRRPFRPQIAGDAYAYPRFDLAAVGK